jgi:hypothetical protein
MHNCPHCHQELSVFAFYCPRCGKQTGELIVEGDMLSAWWLNIDMNPQEKWSMKTLKRGLGYLNLSNISEGRPKHNVLELVFTAVAPMGKEETIRKGVVEIFTEILNPSQEWEIQ